MGTTTAIQPPVCVNSNILSAAKGYIERNYPIIPANTNKMPLVNRGDTWKRNFDLSEFENAPCIGLRLGSETPGVGYPVCIDFDISDENLFYRDLHNAIDRAGIGIGTLTVRSGGKNNGFHVWYRMLSPPDIKPGRLDDLNSKSKIEIFTGTSSRYVIIPPSIATREYKPLYKAGFDLTDAMVIDSRQLNRLIEQIEEEIQNKPRFQKSANNSCNRYQELLASEGMAGDSRVVSQRADKFDSEPSKDLILWVNLLEHLAAISCAAIEIQWDSGRDRSNHFRCLFHPPDTTPSACLHRGKNGHISYADFHYRENRYRPIESVYFEYLRRRGIIPPQSDDSKAYKYLIDMVKEFDYWTPDAISIRDNYQDTRRNLDYLDSEVLKVLDVMVDEAIIQARIGKRQFIATARHIVDRATVSKWTANRSMNLLCALGLFNKSPGKVLRNGATPFYEYELSIPAWAVRENYDKLVKAGFKNLKTFTRAVEMAAFGKTTRNR
jgi:predicted transcriptional regulator